MKTVGGRINHGAYDNLKVRALKVLVEHAAKGNAPFRVRDLTAELKLFGLDVSQTKRRGRGVVSALCGQLQRAGALGVNKTEGTDRIYTVARVASLEQLATWLEAGPTAPHNVKVAAAVASGTLSPRDVRVLVERLGILQKTVNVVLQRVEAACDLLRLSEELLPRPREEVGHG